MKKLLLSTLSIFSVFALQAETFQVDFSNPGIEVSCPQEITTNVSTGPGVHYNSYYKQSWIMNYNGSSFIDISFTNNLSESEYVFLDIVHLASMVRNTNYSPISIILNNNEVIKGFSPVFGYYQTDSFDITSFVKTGENKLRISFDDDAFSNYWIQKLEVNFQ